MLDVTRKLVELLDLSPIGDDHFQGDSEDPVYGPHPRIVWNPCVMAQHSAARKELKPAWKPKAEPSSA